MSIYYHRQSLRLKHYDYSSEGYYFITIVAQNREHLFGEIVDGVMGLSVAGLMVEEWYIKLEEKFPNIKNHEMVIMPNHIHFIIEIQSNRSIANEPVGADPCVRPLNGEINMNTQDNIHVQGQTHGSAPTEKNISKCNIQNNVYIGDIIQWFKTMTTNKYIKMVKNNTLPPFNKRIWQRNYYEHIVRDENDYTRIAEYIINNPITWNDDVLSKNES